MALDMQFVLVLVKAPSAFEPHSSAVCIERPPHTDLHPGGLDVAFVNHNKPAAELPVALSVEVVGLRSSNNENKPLQ